MANSNVKLGLANRAIWAAFSLLAIILSGATTTFADTPETADARKSPSSAEIVFNEDFPDPSLIRAENGGYYAYATQAILEDASSKQLNIQIISSDDLQHWARVGDALPAKPVWAAHTQKFWAPHVVMKSAGHYLLYYSADPDKNTGLCLGVAQAAKPEGPFVDKGEPLVCGKSFENIDPMAFVDPVSKRNFLYWGSAGKPLKIQELKNDGLNFVAGTKPILLENLVVPTKLKAPKSYRRLIEGSWMAFHDGSYFLFFSGDNCCNPNPHYGVMVAKSKSPQGPFQFLQPPHLREAILESFGHFLAPGHNALIDDQTGQTWIYFHAIDQTNPNLQHATPGDRSVRRILMRAKLNWSGPRPTVEIR